MIEISLTDFPSFKRLMESFVDYGYLRVDMVLEPGEFAVRGGIVDVFPSNHSHPLRIEYFGDDIDRIVSFNIHNQRAISNVQVTKIAKNNRKSSPYFSNRMDTPDTALLADIRENDYIVHELFGVGICKGLVRRTFNNHEGEFLFIQYKGEDKLYVPIDQLHLIHPYQAGDQPRLNGLYDGGWKKTTERVQKSVELLAKDVVDLYKIRTSKKGIMFSEDSELQLEMESSFEFQETRDQLKAISEIKRDMESSFPMDRLLCGDVGYGKTEVLIRAAFKAADNLKQVAILAPTTLLAEQHFRTFHNRFKPYPFEIALLSRFQTKSEQKDILKRVKEHKVDIIIGTHRLLSSDVRFGDLGLLIIDEEQRFGVDHKEHLKRLKENVDVITVSATPIPRTLYMSLTGSRELSTIETPPFKRKPVLTAVEPFSDELLKKAINQEIKREGQVYYLYNQVRSMPKKCRELRQLFPDLSIVMAHGQLDENRLNETMDSFRRGDIDILVCSTIIENGLDVPTANTIIIETPEKFGLSQIHQLRGRVGRTPTQAYAWLLFDPVKVLTEVAEKRLQAIKEYASLGSGYKLALKDLEIRGAGALLGKKQSGHVMSVGFDLYCQLLDDSVRRLKKLPLNKRNPIQLPPQFSTFIPSSYIESERERLALYQRLLSLKYIFECDDLLDELQDRYGDYPKLVEMMFSFVRNQLE